MDEKTEGLVGGMDSQGHGGMQLKTKASDRRTGPEIEWGNVGDLTGKALRKPDLELSLGPPGVSLTPAPATGCSLQLSHCLGL